MLPPWLHGLSAEDSKSLNSSRVSEESNTGSNVSRAFTGSVVALLKACAHKKHLQKGTRLHADIVRSGLLEKNSYIAASLVSMYAKCGALTKAQKVLSDLPLHDVVTWNALIAAYVNQGQGEEALNCLNRMQSEGLAPNAVTFSCILKACGSIRAIEKGKQIHDELAVQGLLEKNSVVANALVDMYARCNSMTIAQQVFDELPMKNVVTWNALIAGYVQQGQVKEALRCFDLMQHDGYPPDEVTFVCSLKACSSLRAANKGKSIHKQVIEQGFLSKNIALGNTLLDMYAKCGLLLKAQEVFNELPIRDIVSWSALIAGYAQEGLGEDALNCYEHMQLEGLLPEVVIFSSILTACGSIGAVDKGKEIHNIIVSQGLLGKNIILGTALLDMYAKCNALTEAQKIFDDLPFHNVVCWSALIAGYTQQGQGKAALNCFDCMRSEGFMPNAVTFACILKACSSIGSTERGKEIHDEIVHEGLLQTNIVLANALVDMYCKCGALETAMEVLNELPVRDVFSWSALIAGYVEQEQFEEALDCAERMQSDGVIPDAATLTCILKACGSIGAADKGAKIHDQISTQGWLGKDIALGTALVDMYIKFSAFSKAQKVIDELPIWDVISWNALITGYAQEAQGKEALNCFHRMLHGGISPNAVTYTCVLNACSRSGR